MIAYVIFFICMSVLFIAVAAIMWVRNKKSIIPVKSGEGDERDFLEAIVDGKRQRLTKNPWGMKLSTYITIAVMSSAIGGAICYFLTHNIVTSVVFAMVGMFAPEAIEAFRANREAMKFEERYARSLRQLAASLKAGLSVSQAVTDITESPFIHDSVRHEFMQVDSDLKLGIPVHEAFQRFADRVGTHDSADVATAISMQQQVGGNTSLVVEVIAKDINTRILNRRETKSLFAGTASTITMMDAVPLVIIVLVGISAPQYFEPFFQTLLMTIVFWGLIGVTLVGSVVIRRIVAKMKKDCNI